MSKVLKERLVLQVLKGLKVLRHHCHLLDLKERRVLEDHRVNHQVHRVLKELKDLRVLKDPKGPHPTNVTKQMFNHCLMLELSLLIWSG